VQSTSTRAAPTVSGCLDYGIGRNLRRTAGDARKRCARRFQPFLIVVDAKVQRAMSEALPQLLAYLVYPRLRHCFWWGPIDLCDDHTAEMSPNVTPEKNGGDEKDVDDCADHEINLDNN
jgi:hypothetical protein